MWLMPTPPDRIRNTKTLALTIAAGMVLLFVAGVVFAVSRSTSVIITQADALHDADEALRAVTVARAQIELANFHTLVGQEPTPEEAAAIAEGLDDADTALGFAERGVADVIAAGAATESLAFSYNRFDAIARSTIERLRAGESVKRCVCRAG